MAGSLLAVACLLQTPSAPEDNRINWSPIVWEPFTTAGRVVDHAALMVQVSVEGSSAPMLMQLDLGTYSSVLHISTYEELGRADPVHRKTVLLSGTMAGRRFRNESFGFRSDLPEKIAPKRLGTLGSSFFENRILLLDFVRQRVAILGKGAALPRALERGVEFLPVEYEYGHVLMSATVDGRKLRHLIFDTGSSMIPLFTGHRLWMQLTHHIPDDPANSTIRLSSWGNDVDLVGAPVPQLCVGSACLSQPLVYCEGAGRLPNLDFDRYCEIAAGVVGNVLFDERYTVMVDIAKKRIGILRGSLPREN